MKQIDGIEMAGYDGPNYKTLLASGSWRVAFLNHGDKFSPERPERLERHLETDEVFVLLDGSATLFVGKEMNSVKMERFFIYNVKRGVWHQIHTEPGARCLIVENVDTSPSNSEYCEVV